MANYPELKLYIAGEWRQRDGQPVINPADESTLAIVPHASRTDLDDALAAAEQGFKVWSRTSPAKRADIILKAVQLIRERVEAMAIAMTLEQGKPIAQSRLEILAAARSSNGTPRRGAGSMAASFRVNPACGTWYCVNRSAWSRLSRRGTSR